MLELTVGRAGHARGISGDVEVVEPSAPSIPAFNPITFRDRRAGTQNRIVDLGNPTP